MEDSSPNPTEKPNVSNAIKEKKVPIIIGVSVLVVVAIVGLAAGLSGGASEISQYSQKACEEDKPSALDVNACMESDCYFDTESCNIVCPFGYERDDGCEVSCECAKEGEYQGDIVFGKDGIDRMERAYGVTKETDFAVFSGSAAGTGKLWSQYPEGERFQIYYEIKEEIANESVASILQAMEYFRERTCIDFLPRPGEELPYFTFGTGTGCSSAVGYASYMLEQTISLDEDCFEQQTIKHQLLHLLGFEHEQSRPDRDAYVRVVFENVLQNKHLNFLKLSRDAIGTVYAEYDIPSVLHFASKAFSRNGKDTIVRRDNAETIYEAMDVSKSDLEEVQMLYGCLGKSQGEWTMWNEWSMCDVSCGSGFQARYRRCEDVSGELVDICEGSSMAMRDCNLPCLQRRTANKGTFKTVYSSPCPVTCGGGITVGTYKCMPEGADCNHLLGYREEVHPIMMLECNTKPCPSVDTTHLWGSWGEWAKCDVTCGLGHQTRSRKCFTGNEKSSKCFSKLDSGLAGVEFHHEKCELEDCLTKPTPDPHPWEEWSQCYATCDGLRVRTRKCGAMRGCARQSEACNTGICSNPGPQAFTTRSENYGAGICSSQERVSWQFGDFNGDGRMDPACIWKYRDTIVEYAIVAHSGPGGKLHGASWKGKGCLGKLHVGDINGDGRSDFLCNRRYREGTLTYKIATKEGGFGSGVTEAPIKFCSEKHDRLYLMDANGDGKVDLLCHYEDKRVVLRLNTKFS